MLNKITGIARCASWLAATGALACSSLGGDGGGASNLPNRGVVPYDPVELGDETAPSSTVLAPPAEDLLLGAPGAVVVGDESVVVFVEVRPKTPGTPSAIHGALSDDGGITFDALSIALDPTAAPWAGGGVASPAVVHDPASGLRMAFASADGRAIGLAYSLDGRSFVPDEAPILEAAEAWEQGGVGAPSLVEDGGRWLLYYQATPAAEGDTPARPAIARAILGTAGEVRREGIVFQANTGCTGPDGGELPCWDRDGVGQPEVRRATDGAGRTVYRLFYGGRGGSSRSLGFAASPDGLTFSRYPFNPVLTGQVDEPTNVLLAERYLLFWATSKGISLGINDRGQPADRF